MGKSDVTADRPAEAFEVLVRFGALMWRAGSTAIRTREWMELLARKLGYDALAVSFSLENISASAHGSGEWKTMVRAIGPPAVNAARIAELEQLARTAGAETSISQIEARLSKIEAAPPLCSAAQISAAIAMASGSFAFLNGAGAVEVSAAAIGGAAGQWLRHWLSHRQLNQYGAAALSAIMASSAYVLIAAVAQMLGFGFGHYSIGFIASVLFLIPGFPLIAALFDLLQLQTVPAMSRLAYGLMILLAAAVGLGVVIAIARVDLWRPPPLAMAYPLQLLLRAAASFIACSAFSLSFNTPPRIVIGAGLLAMAANSFRLAMLDLGLLPATAAFWSALIIGVVALIVNRRFDVPRMAMTVAPIVIMIPGLYAFETIAQLNDGQTLEAIQTATLCGFVIGALAMGLAAARLLRP
jgi:uncharacterized membrane protein YjjP (DUF1212 family)